MNKNKLLETIASEISCCKTCKKGKVGRAVPGEGNPDADVVFIGEAPGREEAKTGRPFVGRSGKLLRSLIKNIGLTESDVFITSPVKYLPKYKTPKNPDILHGKDHLEEQLSVIDPKIIVLLGSVACQALLGQKIPIVKEHGKIIKKDNRDYFIALHPAAAIRFVKFKTMLLSDFQKLKVLLPSVSGQ